MLLYLTSATHLPSSDVWLSDSLRSILYGTFFYESIIYWYYYISHREQVDNNVPMCYATGSREVDENNEECPSKEVRSNNNVLNHTVPRKRVPKVILQKCNS